jgi:hypothetical protein
VSEDRDLLRLRALLEPAPATLPAPPPGWVWQQPLPPRRPRPPPEGKGALEPDDPEPETLAAGACRFCGTVVDLRDSGGDPDGGWSHLECWAAAGHPDVGWLGPGPDPEALAWALWHGGPFGFSLPHMREALGRDPPGLARMLLAHGLRPHEGGLWGGPMDERPDRWAQALELASAFFGDRATAERWADTPQPALDGRTPRQTAEAGEADEVVQLMRAIVEGTYS